MKNKNVLYLTQAAMIAALYVVLTMIANALGIASGNIQVRFSEALTVLPFLTPAAVPGLFIGCLIANLVTGAMLPDIIFGSLATLIGAIGTWMLGKAAHGKDEKQKKLFTWLSPLPPILARLRHELGLSETKKTTDDLMFTVETVSCLGACGLAPVITVNDHVHAEMTPDKASAILKKLKEDGEC